MDGFSGLRAACLPCAGPRYDAAWWAGCETQPLAVAPFFFFGRFFDAIPAMLSMRGRFRERLLQRDVQEDSGRWRTSWRNRASDNREVLQVSREQANRRVAGKLRADVQLSPHCCTLVGLGTESPHRPEHHTFIQDVSMVLSSELRRHGRFLRRNEDEPCMGCGVVDPSRGGSARG